MSLPIPIVNAYTVYTKQKCPYCVKVKELLATVYPAPMIVECDDFLEAHGRDIFWQEMETRTAMRPGHRTFPIVFFDENYIGGHSETVKFFDSQLRDDLFSCDFTMDF